MLVHCTSKNFYIQFLSSRLCFPFFFTLIPLFSSLFFFFFIFSFLSFLFLSIQIKNNCKTIGFGTVDSVHHCLIKVYVSLLRLVLIKATTTIAIEIIWVSEFSWVSDNQQYLVKNTAVQNLNEKLNEKVMMDGCHRYRS